MAGLFRKFVVPGFKRRWGKSHADTFRGVVVEGYYRTFYNFVRQLVKDLIRWKWNLMSTDWNLLKKREKANIHRMVGELSFLIASVILITIFSKMGDDDDEWIIGFGHYQAYRFMSEISFFFNPVQTMNILRTPAATFGVVENLIRLFGQFADFVDGPGERFESGPWKDHRKIEKHIVNVFGIGYKQWFRLRDVETQINWFQ